MKIFLFLTTFLTACWGFTLHRSSSIHTSCSSAARISHTLLFAAPGTPEAIPNEFSRPLRTETILGPRRKDYKIEISAKSEELQNLAKRFSLSNIEKLSADLTLTRNEGSSYARGGAECIQVRGGIEATVTQTCVRTNEGFEVDLEFDLNALVRSAGVRRENDDGYGNKSANDDVSLGGMSAAELEAAVDGGGRNSRKQKHKKRRRSNGGNNLNMVNSNAANTLNEMRMKEIQELLENFDVEEDIVEDENIFGVDGIIDVGELVAQTFRLKLDPYPKKPGSEPVSYSITG